MAASSDIVLNHALCFLFSKIHKLEDKYIKSSMLAFYTAVDIHEAKEVLMSAVSALSDQLSKVRDRRDGEGRGSRELDDVFLIVKELDEKFLLSKLPKFVSDSPEKMPSCQLIDGDLRAIMNRFSKMESTVEQLQTTINKSNAAITDIVATVHGRRVEDPSVAPYSLQPTWAEQATAGFSSCDDQIDDRHESGDWQSGERKKRRRMRSDLNQSAARHVGDTSVSDQSIQFIQPATTQANQRDVNDRQAIFLIWM